MWDIKKTIYNVENKTISEFTLKERLLKYFLIMGVLIPFIFYFSFSFFENVSYNFNQFLYRLVLNIFLYLILGAGESKFEYNFWGRFRDLLRKKQMKKIYRNYIFITGVFCWGWPLGLSFIVIEWDLNSTIQYNLIMALLNIIIWSLAGYLYGYLYRNKIKQHIENNYKV